MKNQAHKDTTPSITEAFDLSSLRLGINAASVTALFAIAASLIGGCSPNSSADTVDSEPVRHSAAGKIMTTSLADLANHQAITPEEAQLRIKNLKLTEATLVSADTTLNRLADRIKEKTSASPDDMSDLVSMLASDDLSDITGSLLRLRAHFNQNSTSPTPFAVHQKEVLDAVDKAIAGLNKLQTVSKKLLNEEYSSDEEFAQVDRDFTESLKDIDQISLLSVALRDASRADLAALSNSLTPGALNRMRAKAETFSKVADTRASSLQSFVKGETPLNESQFLAAVESYSNLLNQQVSDIEKLSLPSGSTAETVRVLKQSLRNPQKMLAALQLNLDGELTTASKEQIELFAKVSGDISKTWADISKLLFEAEKQSTYIAPEDKTNGTPRSTLTDDSMLVMLWTRGYYNQVFPSLYYTGEVNSYNAQSSYRVNMPVGGIERSLNINKPNGIVQLSKNSASLNSVGTNTSIKQFAMTIKGQSVIVRMQPTGSGMSLQSLRSLNSSSYSSGPSSFRSAASSGSSSNLGSRFNSSNTAGSGFRSSSFSSGSSSFRGGSSSFSSGSSSFRGGSSSFSSGGGGFRGR